MGERCIITDKDKHYHVYLQWHGKLHDILGILDGVKRLHDATKHYQSRVDLFHFAVCIQNWFGRLGYHIYARKYIELKDGEEEVADNGHYEIDFDKLEIVKLYKNINNSFTATYKQALYEKEELQEMIRQEREFRSKDIASISQKIFDANKVVFGAME